MAKLTSVTRLKNAVSFWSPFWTPEGEKNEEVEAEEEEERPKTATEYKIVIKVCREIT